MMPMNRGTNAGLSQQQKRQRTAALQDLAEAVARDPSRQRLGVRLSSAAVPSVRRQEYETFELEILFLRNDQPARGFKNGFIEAAAKILAANKPSFSRRIPDERPEH